MELAMVNDTIMPIEQATISAHDRCVYFGDGVYEVVRFCQGKLFAMQAHMQRLRNSLEKMDMLEKVDLAIIEQRIDRVLKQADIADAVVYFQISRGQASRSHDYQDDWQPGFLLTLREYHPRQRTGKAIFHPDWRWKRCDIKSLNLLANVLAKHAATRAGAFEALLVDENNLVTEATSSSVLLVRGNVLQTAPLTANILPGITRALLLEWADQMGLAVRQESFTPEDVFAADEVIITGTGSAVMSITHVDGRPVGGGKPGAVSVEFSHRLRRAMEEE